MRRLLAIVLFVAATAASTGCYVTEDENGQWWACDNYDTPNGVATACTPIDRPF